MEVIEKKRLRKKIDLSSIGQILERLCLLNHFGGSLELESQGAASIFRSSRPKG